MVHSPRTTEPRRARGPRPLKRRVHLVVGGETQEWSYQLASRGILVRTPDMRTTHTVAYRDLLRPRCDDDERRVGLAPSLIKAYVQRVFVDQLPWSYAEHVGAIYFGGGTLVYKDALTAKAEKDEARRLYQLPLRVTLARVSKHRWLTLREMGPLLYTTQGDRSWFDTSADIRAVVDPLISLYTDEIVEADRSLSDPEVRFRLRWEHRDASLDIPKVAIFSEADWAKLEGRVPRGAETMSSWYVWESQWAVARKFAVPRKGGMLEIIDAKAFTEACEALGCRPRITDRY